jgi:regulator of cell morphogenesis and NO signaling
MKTSLSTLQQEPFELNVTVVDPLRRHQLISEHFDALSPGQSFYIVSDRDLKPLYNQLLTDRGNSFSWNDIGHAPLTWKVLLQKSAVQPEPTIGEMVAADIRKADVFRKWGIDFCCGGRKSLRQACAEKEIDINAVEDDLKATCAAVNNNLSSRFNEWKLDFLTDYIYNQHHQYWYNEEPSISQIVAKVAGHHGAHHPALIRVSSLYERLREELNIHFIKEEQVLFPHIRQLAYAESKNDIPGTNVLNIDEALNMMLAEHEMAGELLQEIRIATSDYQLPANACNSFAFMYHKLKSLETDLQQHIHLENNILFPKAALLHKKYFNQSYAKHIAN